MNIASSIMRLLRRVTPPVNLARPTGAAAVAVVFLSACSPATDGTATPDPDKGSTDLLVDRVWSRVDANAAPASIRIFLSDGVLLQDSCFETYRLSRWRRESPTRIGWSEDGVDITAEVAHPADDELMLRMFLRSDEVVESYVTAPSPFVCPDFPR